MRTSPRGYLAARRPALVCRERGELIRAPPSARGATQSHGVPSAGGRHQRLSDSREFVAAGGEIYVYPVVENHIGVPRAACGPHDGRAGTAIYRGGNEIAKARQRLTAIRHSALAPPEFIISQGRRRDQSRGQLLRPRLADAFPGGRKRSGNIHGSTCARRDSTRSSVHR